MDPTTTTKGPRGTTAPPKTLQISVDLGGFKFSPEVMKSDGFSRKKNPEVVLSVSTSGEGDLAEEFLAFLTHVRGNLAVAITPAEDTDLDGWQGVGTIGPVKLDLATEGPLITFPLSISHSNVTTLEALIGVRLAMHGKGESNALLELVAVQPDLEFETDADQK